VKKIKNAVYAYLNFEFSNKHKGSNFGVGGGGGVITRVYFG